MSAAPVTRPRGGTLASRARQSQGEAASPGLGGRRAGRQALRRPPTPASGRDGRGARSPRARPVAARRVDVPGGARILEVGPPVGGVAARPLERHVRVVAARHHDRGERQPQARHGRKAGERRVARGAHRDVGGRHQQRIGDHRPRPPRGEVDEENGPEAVRHHRRRRPLGERLLEAVEPAIEDRGRPVVLLDQAGVAVGGEPSVAASGRARSRSVPERSVSP